MLPYFTEAFGNPSSIYSYGQEAKGGIEEPELRWRNLLARGARRLFLPVEERRRIISLKGVAYANEHKGNHIITSSLEHHAVLRCASFWRLGA